MLNKGKPHTRIHVVRPSIVFMWHDKSISLYDTRTPPIHPLLAINRPPVLQPIPLQELPLAVTMAPRDCWTLDTKQTKSNNPTTPALHKKIKHSAYNAPWRNRRMLTTYHVLRQRFLPLVLGKSKGKKRLLTASRPCLPYPKHRRENACVYSRPCLPYPKK